MWPTSDSISQVTPLNSWQHASGIEGVFGPDTEKLQSGVSRQEVVLVLHSSRRKQLLGLSSKVANMKLLQLLLETHSAWHSSSDSRSKTAPTMFEIGSREQRSPLWKRSHRAASDSHEELVRRWRKSSFLTNMTWCCALFCTLHMLGLLIFSVTSQNGSSGWLVGLFPSELKGLASYC